jgi:hypothetical protein
MVCNDDETALASPVELKKSLINMRPTATVVVREDAREYDWVRVTITPIFFL